jgi:hypothetical protein
MSRVLILLSLLALCHCGAPPEQPSDPANELMRSVPASSDHGLVALGSTMESELSRASSVHRWQFTLSGRADVALRTEASVASQPGDREVDTVLVLQRIEDGGARSWLAQNDDAPGTRYSRIERGLPGGRYELEVHGFTPRVRGRFAVVTGCTGEGCPRPEPRCLFGDVFSDLRSHPSLSIASEVWITAPEQLVSELERSQLVLAVQQSTHTDVTSASEAIAVVDQGEVRRLELHDASTTYLAFEYGAGDNSYGAIFVAGSTEVQASIHDGDLIDCRLLAP